MATFYVARSEIITPLPWLTFALPFSASSEAEWREALTTLIVDAKLRLKMGAAGRKHVVETYSIQVQGPRVASLLAHVAGRNGAV